MKKWWALSFIYTLRPEQDGRHFADDILKGMFLKENDCISIQIMMRLIPKGPIDSKWVWVQVMAWCLFSANPLLKPIVTQFTDLIYVSPVASSTKEVNPLLAKPPLKTNGHLANRRLTSLVKEATGLNELIQYGCQGEMPYH